ncbi:hypothetical protein [Saccharothrix coeruleofusca]|uniref:hypothetical protein n=1 Tax=Saccharothrix coeruleofusca TaxID=33919 RepID=UPI001670D1BC|nr:hypothetical protein [Saccharothrix coeruleofusca]
MIRLPRVLLALLLVAPPVAVEATPGDRPLPGRTIDNPPLLPALVGGQPSRVFQGVHRHAAHALFDFLLDYQLVAWGLAGVRACPLPPDRTTAAHQAALNLDGTPNALGAQPRAIAVERSGGQRPGVQGVGRVLGGLPVRGDRAARRGQADRPGAVAARPWRPVRAVLHGAGLPRGRDPQRPRAPGGAARDPHGRALRVQPGRGGAPWRDLLAWVDRGERPAGDVVDDPPC